MRKKSAPRLTRADIKQAALMRKDGHGYATIGMTLGNRSAASAWLAVKRAVILGDISAEEARKGKYLSYSKGQMKRHGKSVCVTCKGHGMFPKCPHTGCGKSSAAPSRVAVKPKELLKPIKKYRLTISNSKPTPVIPSDKTLVVFRAEMRKPSLWTILCKAYKAWKNWGIDDASKR